MAKILIDHGYVIPMTEPEKVIVDGAVAIDGNRLVYVGSSAGLGATGFKPDQTINASGKVVLPGLINTHTHLIGAYIKALTEDVSGMDSAGLYKRAIPISTRFVKDEDFYCGCMTHAMEMVMTGTTTISNTWTGEKRAAPPMRDLGVRAVLSEMIWDTEVGKINATVMERPIISGDADRGLEAAAELYEQWHGKADGRITTRVSPAGPGYTSQYAMDKCRDLADKLGTGINIHLAEVPGETEFILHNYGKRPVALAKDLGLMGPQTIAFHCVFLSDEDIRTFAETGAHISHTSFHVPKRGYFPPMEKVYAAGVSVSWGSDWCSNDLWKFMRAGILIPRQKTGDVTMLNGWRALHMATMGGARALGMENEIGSLEAGKKADVILVDVDTPWCRPIRTQNLPTNIVYNANGSDVTDVIIDGRVVVKDREIKTVDRKAILKETQERAERIWSDASEIFAG
jgi:5-methylthioadenosine/S-adenosylhomocysteine deaminase